MRTDIELIKNLPIFAGANASLIKDIASSTSIKTFPQGQELAYEGMNSEWFFIVLSGSIRVYKMSDTGKEVTLFNIHEQQSCILTIFSILSQKSYPAFASTQTELKALMIPSALFKKWTDEHSMLRDYIFQSLSGRLTDILNTFDQVIFQRMDRRIARFILEKCKNEGDTLDMTHEQISHELGTNRVVISRILETFSADSAITLDRGHITLQDKTYLQSK
jgi:CRP/FNR family transcriptional regulator